MPDDDCALGQNEVDVRNEARRYPMSPAEFARKWLRVDQTTIDLHQAIDHLRRLNETAAINAEAEQRRQESITRTLDEIQRLMDA